jgi:hypothetical protein
MNVGFSPCGMFLSDPALIQAFSAACLAVEGDALQRTWIKTSFSITFSAPLKDQSALASPPRALKPAQGTICQKSTGGMP